MIQDIHVLVVDPDEAERTAVASILRQAGAVVHTSCGRTEALFRYLTLFADDIIPRGIVTAWWLNVPTTAEFEFYKMIGREEDNTAVNLIRRVRVVDPDVTIIVREDDIDPRLASSLDFRSFSRKECISELIPMLDTDTKIIKHRIRRDSEEIQVEV